MDISKCHFFGFFSGLFSVSLGCAGEEERSGRCGFILGVAAIEATAIDYHKRE